jgi:hypothetical protein
MSSLMGLPLALRDEDVSAPLPVFPNQSQRNIGLELHVKLCKVTATILNSELTHKTSPAHVLNSWQLCMVVKADWQRHFSAAQKRL